MFSGDVSSTRQHSVRGTPLKKTTFRGRVVGELRKAPVTYTFSAIEALMPLQSACVKRLTIVFFSYDQLKPLVKTYLLGN